MNNIKIEEADLDQVQYVLGIFSGHKSFSQGENFDFLDDLEKHPRKIELNEKNIAINAIYDVNKNLVDWHNQQISEKIDNWQYPYIDVKNPSKPFLKTMEELDNFSTLSITAHRDSHINYDQDTSVLLDREKIISSINIDKMENKVKNFISTFSQYFKYSVVSDLLLFSFNEGKRNEYLKEASLNYIEDHRILRNTKDLSENYIDNIITVSDRIITDPIRKLDTLFSIYDFMDKRYIKDDRDIVIDKINEKIGFELAQPDMLKQYYSHNSNLKINSLDFSVVKIYASEHQVDEILEIIFDSGSANDDLMLVNLGIENGDDDIFESLSGKNTLFAKAIDYFRNEVGSGQRNQISDIALMIERKLDQYSNFPISPIKQEPASQNKMKM